MAEDRIEQHLKRTYGTGLNGRNGFRNLDVLNDNRFLFMKFFVYIFVICGTLASCTASCDRSEGEVDTRERKINFFVWGEYTSRGIFEDFTAQTGISVVESNFASNEELLAKIQAGADGYDLIIPSDYMVTVMTQLDLLAPLDLAAIPNAKNLDPELTGQPHDPTNKWSLPYSWALTGIVYNQEKVTPAISSYRELYTREDIKHRFSILDDSREAIAGILKSNGHSANATDPNIIEETKQSLLAVKKRSVSLWILSLKTTTRKYQATWQSTVLSLSRLFKIRLLKTFCPLNQPQGRRRCHWRQCLKCSRRKPAWAACVEGSLAPLWMTSDPSS